MDHSKGHFQIFHLFQSLHASADDPCSVRNTVTFCDPFRYTFSFCVFLMVLNQYFMYVDRLLDTFWTPYKAAQKYILTTLLAIEVRKSDYCNCYVFVLSWGN